MNRLFIKGTYQHEIVSVSIMLFIAQTSNVMILYVPNGICQPVPHLFNGNLQSNLNMHSVNHSKSVEISSNTYSLRTFYFPSTGRTAV